MYINILLERHPYSTTWKKVQGIGQVPGRYNQQDMSEIGTNLDKREKRKLIKANFVHAVRMESLSHERPSMMLQACIDKGSEVSIVP